MKTRLGLAEEKEGNLRSLPFSRNEINNMISGLIKVSVTLLIVTAVFLSSCTTGTKVMNKRYRTGENKRIYHANNPKKDVFGKRFKTKENNRVNRAMNSIQYQ